MGSLPKYDQILSSARMQSSYLDSFNLNKLKLPKVSAIVPTYNRCPHSIKSDANPLGWCLESLIDQKGGVLDEIIVMDDASSDNTQKVVRSFRNRSPVDIKYFRNKRNQGSSINRNKAVEKSRNDHVIFLDDDCIFSNYFVFGAAYSLENLPDDVAVVHMPIYHRRAKPLPGDIKEIGVLDLDTGLMTGNFGNFPVSFAEDIDANLLNKEMGIVKPFEISNLGGVFISKKHPFQHIGGFPSFLTWKNGYREETNVAIELAKAGYGMYFNPDPKFYSIHLKYGARGFGEDVEDVDSKLKRLISYSSVPIQNTGNRVDVDEWFFDRIISTYVTLGRQNKKAALQYLSDIKKSFVDKNELAVSGVGTKINNMKRRQDIFLKAIREGKKLIERVA